MMFSLTEYILTVSPVSMTKGKELEIEAKITLRNIKLSDLNDGQFSTFTEM